MVDSPAAIEISTLWRTAERVAGAAGRISDGDCARTLAPASTRIQQIVSSREQASMNARTREDQSSPAFVGLRAESAYAGGTSAVTESGGKLFSILTSRVISSTMTRWCSRTVVRSHSKDAMSSVAWNWIAAASLRAS
jgi:hypothetical protein